jgi:hypothetical protein
MSRNGSEMNNDRREVPVRLIDDPQLLFRASRKIGDLGVVGEERNRLILFLAGITRSLPSPTSVLIKGASSTGKTTQAKASVQLFPTDCVLERSGLSGKALAHGEGSLAQKILFLHEYRCGKDAQLLLRLLQSDGEIKHEFTTVRGAERGTQVAERAGFPVVLTTTTDKKVYPDDETRFLSLWADESPEQNRAIVVARASGRRTVNDRNLPAWRRATSVLLCRAGDFENPPSWLCYVAENLPLGKVRVRRDWDRFLSFLNAIAICRAGSRRGMYGPLNVSFADYCIGYLILEPVFASTLEGIRTQEYELGKAVAKLNQRLRRAATVREVAAELSWKESVVYKHVKGAVTSGLLDYEGGARERNEKRLLARGDGRESFLPKPQLVLKNNPEIGELVEYIDPFTGENRAITRRKGEPVVGGAIRNPNSFLENIIEN